MHISLQHVNRHQIVSIMHLTGKEYSRTPINRPSSSGDWQVAGELIGFLLEISIMRGINVTLLNTTQLEACENCRI